MYDRCCVKIYIMVQLCIIAGAYDRRKMTPIRVVNNSCMVVKYSIKPDEVDSQDEFIEVSPSSWLSS